MYIPLSDVTNQLYVFSSGPFLDDGQSVDVDSFLDLICDMLFQLRIRRLAEPDSAAAVINIIRAFDAYIMYRAPAYELLYPVVSFLQVFHAAMLTTSDIDFLVQLLDVEIDVVSMGAF